MEIKKTIAWSFVKEENHKSLSKEERMVIAQMPILGALFPGIEYYSLSGFYAVKRGYGISALKKQMPDLENLSPGKIKKDEMVEIKPFLKSKGYEWEDSKEWDKKFKELLAA